MPSAPLAGVRIALLSMDYPPRMAGGTTIHTRALALALLEEGHEVHVVAARTPEAPNEEVREGVNVHRVRSPYTAWSGTYVGRLDLAGIAAWQLAHAGLDATNVATLAECTRCRGDLYHSYRRDGTDAGRQAMAVRLKG